MAASTHQRERAAHLVADDTQTNEQIAAEVGVSLACLNKWKTQTRFHERVAEIQAAYAASLDAEGIANRRNRVKALQDEFDRLEQVIAERAEDPSMADIPGGTTGIVVRQIKQIGMGRDAQVVEEYAVDTGTLKERRSTLQQAAQELGQWTEKREQSGEILIRRYIGVDLDQL